MAVPRCSSNTIIIPETERLTGVIAVLEQGTVEPGFGYILGICVKECAWFKGPWITHDFRNGLTGRDSCVSQDPCALLVSFRSSLE